MVRFSNIFTKFELLFRLPQLYIFSFIFITITIKIIITIANKRNIVTFKTINNKKILIFPIPGNVVMNMCIGMNINEPILSSYSPLYVTRRDHVVHFHGSQECWFTLCQFRCQFHSRRHSLRITLKSTTLVHMRSRYAWTRQSWQRSEWRLDFNSVSILPLQARCYAVLGGMGWGWGEDTFQTGMHARMRAFTYVRTWE